LPVILQASPKAGDPAGLARTNGPLDFRQRACRGLPKFGQALAIGGSCEMRTIQKVIPDENAREMDVRTEKPELRLNMTMKEVHLIELRVHILHFAASSQKRGYEQ
jgi:hypothetical protein